MTSPARPPRSADAPALPPDVVARLLGHVSDAVACVDRAWRLTYLNPRGGALLGCEPHLVVGRVIWEALPALADGGLQAAAERAMLRGEPGVGAAALPGGGRELAYRLEPFPGGLAIVAAERAAGPTDPTGEDHLREQSRYLRAVLDTAPDCVSVYTRDHALLDMNASGLAMLDAPSLAALRGRDLRTLVAEADRPAFEALHAGAIAGRSARLEFEVTTLAGRRRRLESDAAPLRDAFGRIVGALHVTRDVTARREAEARLRESEARFRTLAEAAPLGVYMVDARGEIVYVNPRCTEILGHTSEALLAGGWTEHVHPDDRAQMIEVRRAFRDGDTDRGRAEWRVVRGDGEVRTVSAVGVRLRDRDGGTAGFVGMLEDVTARRALEEQLRHAQKMEAVGQLAGGIAHDFNNLLTIVTGHLDFARQDVAALAPPGHSVHDDLREIAQAAERARRLVRQLLAFSRKQVITPQAVDLVEVVRGAEQLLRRVLGAEIVLGTTFADGPAVVRADAVQLEQVLVNLAVNARDAMLTAAHGHAGHGGTLHLEVDGHDVTPGASGGWALPAGPYVRLTVRDSGHGMDAETRAHVFEPFFTTKPIGAGTGLGLATVYGIVRQSGGAIRVESTPGVGATFTILLPALAQPADRRTASEPPAVRRGRGTVLVVEDEAAVRATTRRVLERHGYAVLEARHGADALLLWGPHADVVCAVVTDLRMPEMGGRELVARLRTMRPALPVVYVSGYSDEAGTAASLPWERFVDKPFAGAALLAALDAAIAVAGDAGAAHPVP